MYPARTLLLKVIRTAFFLGIGLLTILFYLAYVRVQSLLESSNQVNHSQLVRIELERLLSWQKDVESKQRAYLLTGDTMFIRLRSEAEMQTNVALRNLGMLVSDNPRQVQNVLDFQKLVNSHVQLLHSDLNGNRPLHLSLDQEATLLKRKALLDEMRTKTEEMGAIELELLKKREQVRDYYAAIAPWFMAMLFLVALIFLVLAFLKIRRDLYELRGQLSANQENIDQINDLNETLQYAKQIAHAGSWHVDLKTGKRRYSPNTYRLLGLEPEAFEPSLENLLAYIHPEDRDIFKTFSEAVVRREAPQPVEIRVKRTDGEERYWRSAASIITTSHGTELLIGIFQDVTEAALLRHQLEERSNFAEMLIESSVDLIVAYDRELRFIVWNKRCEEIFGLKKEEVLGRYAVDVFPEMKERPIMQELKRAFEGETIHNPPRRGIGPNRIYETFLLPLRDTSDHVTGVLAITHDITESMETAGQLESLNQTLADKNLELERSVAELASFSYAASHDLQEPLRKIQAFSERLLRSDVSNLSESGKDAFERIQSAVSRMQQLIDDLLAYSRTNTSVADFETTDLDALLGEVLHELEVDLHDAGAVIDAPVPLPEARVIPFQFRQLLLNLIGNALKYRKPDQPCHIAIHSETLKGKDLGLVERQDEKFLKITIADNGIGFEQQFAERIFGLFQRLHGRSQYSGTGLGLAICKKIVEKHQGLIWAESSPGKGARFYVAIPL